MRITPSTPQALTPSAAGAAEQGAAAAASSAAPAASGSAAGAAVRVVAGDSGRSSGPDVLAEAALHRAQASAASTRLLAAQNALASASLAGEPAAERAPLAS